MALFVSMPIMPLAEEATPPGRPFDSVPTETMAAQQTEVVLGWGEGKANSDLIAALEVVGFNLAMNQYDRHFLDSEVYHSDFSSFKNNLERGWAYDNDPFAINQFLHPYGGTIYFGAARSTGHGFWSSMGYTTAGSLMWEMAGETSQPSINDLLTTSVGGSILGESLFRMASLLLESGDTPAGVWRELGAAALSPATGFNRVGFGDRFSGIFSSRHPAIYIRAQLGVNINADMHSNINLNPDADAEPIPQSYQEGEVLADVAMSYGLPGKPGYRYRRPFDYFHFQFSAVNSNVFENIHSRGLLYGRGYAMGAAHRGVWGVYGSYDYIAPQFFRVSSTSVGLGSTNQWWLSRYVALQGTAYVGIGYGVAGTLRGAGDYDYHDGVTPQGLLTSRLVFADRAALDVELSHHYVSELGAGEPDGTEHIGRARIDLTIRLHQRHSITLRYSSSSRDAHYPTQPATRQNVRAISLAYTYLGSSGFGAVEW